MANCGKKDENKDEKKGEKIELNWFDQGYDERKALIKEMGETRNRALDMYLKHSKKYDHLKKNFYNLTDTAVEENVITDEGISYNFFHLIVQTVEI